MGPATTVNVVAQFEHWQGHRNGLRMKPTIL
jgi:hypothetical protein